jgi:hypothetical protein
MSFKERLLYHQIHPLKIATDATAGALALPLFWGHHLTAGALVVLVPPVCVSVIVVAGADLSRQKHSALGRYMRRYQTPGVQLLRFAAYGVMLAGAWGHSPLVLAVGLAVLLWCWLHGIPEVLRG